MLNIKIRFRPVTYLPVYRSISAKLPICWDEISEKQLLTVPDFRKGEITDDVMLCTFLGITPAVARRIDSATVLKIRKYLNYLKTAEPLPYFIIKDLAGLHSPADIFKMSFGNFIIGDIYYTYYICGETEYLDRFLGCFYSSAENFDPDNIEINAKMISEADPNLKEAITLNYSLIREFISRTYPRVFISLNEARDIRLKFNSILKLSSEAQNIVNSFRTGILKDLIINNNDLLIKPMAEVLQISDEIMKNSHITSDYADMLDWLSGKS